MNWSRTEACRPLRISTSSSFFADRSWSVTTSSSWQSIKGKSTAGPSNQFVFIIIFVELVIDKNSSFYFIRPTSFFTALDLHSNLLFQIFRAYQVNFNTRSHKKRPSTPRCQSKHRKNCECCPGHYLIVNHYFSMSWFKFCNLWVIVNCVNNSRIALNLNLNCCLCSDRSDRSDL